MRRTIISVDVDAGRPKSTDLGVSPVEDDTESDTCTEILEGADSAVDGPAQEGAVEFDTDTAIGVDAGGGCLSGETQCVWSMECIPAVWECDGLSDCEDGSDEGEHCLAHACASDEFKCTASGTCIPAEWECNDYPNCEDGSDEGVDCGI